MVTKGFTTLVAPIPHPVNPPNPPPPPTFLGAKLVNDAAHPFRAPKKSDLRGPCPGLNTLANHGWLPRDGVATPAQIITAVQEGFNMESRLARTTTYAAHLLDGNPVTDLMSIGAKTHKTGPDPPAPCNCDASMTRADAYFGNNHVFNPALFEEFKNFSMVYGNGFFNTTVSAELRYHRIQQSIATNPTFEMLGFRHTTAYAEASFPATFFVDGRKTGSEAGQLDMVTAERFFKDMQFPVDFHRPAAPVSGQDIFAIYSAHPTLPGKNVNGVNTFQVDTSIGSLIDQCAFYTGFVNVKVKGLYPNPTGILKRNINKNLQFLYDTFAGAGCPQVFPYGQN
ncbi:Chloroperoxidase [Coprinopsis sp. MPI-PUGE-AT-0042]|nr:Chloroperoxidase [Coprinopsis sp. MPI-PUGE-AT-0042]